MPRYRNDGSMPLDYSDSGGPRVEPGDEFEHEIPAAQLASHLRSGFISAVAVRREPIKATGVSASAKHVFDVNEATNSE